MDVGGSMKKYRIIFMVMLLAIVGCDTIQMKNYESYEFGSFAIPSSFQKLESEEPYILEMSDVKNDRYFGYLSISNYEYFENEGFDELKTTIKDEIIPAYSEVYFDGVDYKQTYQNEIEIDSHKAFRTTVRGDDKFVIDYIAIDVVYNDGVPGYVELVFSYSNKEYPNLGDEFIKDYKLLQLE